MTRSSNVAVPRTRRAVRGLALMGLLAGTVAIAGCGSNDTGGTAAGGGDASAASKDSIVIAIPGTPQGVDLDRQSGPQAWTIGGQVLELGAEWKRVAYPFEPTGGVDNSKIPGFTYPAIQEQETEPGIIEKCVLSEGGKVGTYHLRKGVKSAWGNEFTAKDVLYRVERSIANKGIGAFILGSLNADKLSQWTEVDEHTVRIKSKSAMPLLCDVNTNLYWMYLDSTEVKKHATKNDPWSNDWVATHGGSFGPYEITKWIAGQRVELKANPNYWQGEPKIKSITYKVAPESSSRASLLQSGDVQMAEALSPDDLTSLNGKPNVNVGAVRATQSIYIVMNNKQAPFDNPKVRQAVDLMIPRDQISTDVYKGFANPWTGIMPTLYPGYMDFPEYKKQDVEKAKQLLAEAGHPNGFKTAFTYNSGDSVQADVAIAIQSALQEIGIEATVQQQPPGPYADMIQSKKATFGLWVDFPIQPDPNYAMRLFYLTDNAVNYQNYSDKRVDKILEDCVSTTGKERITCNQKAEPIISEAAALGWIAEPYFLIGLSSNLSGWGWYATQYYRVASMSYQ